jgi:hypothetical protein
MAGRLAEARGEAAAALRTAPDDPVVHENTARLAK